MRIHISREGERFGPYSAGEIRDYLGTGELLATDLAWYKGADGWVPLSDLPDLEDNDAVAAPALPPVYHHVAVWKFVTLSFCTVGFYILYWFYRNWRYIKDRDHGDIMPFWRSFFSVIWAFEFSNDVKRSAGSRVVTGIEVVPILYLLFNISWRLPDPYSLLGLFTFVPLVPLVVQIDRINLARGSRAPYHSKFGFASVFFSLLGGLLVFLTVAMSIGVALPDGVMSGDELRSEDLTFLRRNDMLQSDEQPLYFYTLGIFSIEDEGNLLTTKRVVSYYTDPFDDELMVYSAAFGEIEDINVFYSETSWEDTEIEIKTSATDDDEGFVLLVTNLEDGDELFVNRLLELWNAAKVPSPVDGAGGQDAP